MTTEAPTQSAPATRLAVLVFTDIVGSTELKSRLGMATYSRLLGRHNELFESSKSEISGAEIIKHTGDGYFASFPTASDAVRFALQFQSRIGIEPWGTQPLKTRVGIHVGEALLLDMAGRQDVVGLSADVAARLMSLAEGGQILLTSQAFNDARQSVDRSPEILEGTPPLRWLAHGPYLFKGADEALDVFEVGIEKVSPLTRPPDSEKARRVAPHDEEPTLGWRPAIALDIPQRPGWTLVRKIGEGGFGEVWLGLHAKLKEHRVFKFCFDADRLRSLKREFTLFRLFRGALGDREDIAKLHEVKLDEPPFFLESEYTEGGDLHDYAARKGGIETIPETQRVEMVAKVADAVAAAHSIGVLHKDIKPSNVLIAEGHDGTPRPVLSDFGIGVLADREQLRQHAITETGFTALTLEDDTKRTGTRMYAPPESLLNKPFTTQGDVYALGVLLYQMVIGDLSRPHASGWERDVSDPLLREDIGLCVEGNPQRRLQSAAELAQRLRSLPQRREAQARLEAQRNRSRRRRRVLMTSLLMLCLLVAVVAGLSIALLRERQLRLDAELAERNASIARENTERESQRSSLMLARSLATQGDFSGSRSQLMRPINPDLETEWRWAAWQCVRSVREIFRRDLRVDLPKRTNLLPAFSNAGSAEIDLQARRITFKPGTSLESYTIDLSTWRMPATYGATRSVGGRQNLAEDGDSARTAQDLDNLVLKSVQRGDRSVYAQTFAESGEYKAAGLNIGRIVLYHKNENQWKPCSVVQGFQERFIALKFSENAQALHAIAGDWIYHIFVVGADPDIEKWHAHEVTDRRVIFSRDGKRIATLGYDGNLRIWNASDHSLERAIEVGGSNGYRCGDIAFVDSAGNQIISTSEDKFASIWDTKTASQIGTLDFGIAEGHLNVSADGTRSIATAGSTLQDWDLQTRDRKRIVTGPRGTDTIYAGSWRESQNRLFVVYGGPVADATVGADPEGRRWEVWDTNSFTCRPIPSEHDAGLRDVKVSPDGKIVAIASRDGTASLWDWQSATRLRILDVKQGSAHSNIVSSVDFHPSLPLLMTASFDNRIIFWDVPTGRLLAELNVDPTGSKGYGINGLLKEAVFSPDGNSVFACVGGEQWIIDLHFYDPAVKAMDEERRGK